MDRHTHFNSSAAQLLLLTTVLISAIGFFSASGVNIAIPDLQRQLGASIQDIQWILNSFIITSSVFILVSGSLSDSWGRKRILMVGTMIFVGGSVLSALASSAGWLIGARIIQGFGAALMVPQSLAIINSCYDKKIRGTAIGIWGGASGAMSILGPVIAGFLVDSLGWRSVFWITVPLAVIGLIMTWRFVPVLPTTEKVKVDAVGTGLLLGGLLAFSVGLINAQRGLDFTDGILIGVGLVILSGFYKYEKRQKAPLVNFTLLSSPVVLAANIFTLLLYTGIYALGFFIPIYLQQLVGWSALQTSLVMMPMGLAITVLSFFTGVLADKYGARLMMTTGAVTVALGYGALLMVSERYTWLSLPSLGLLLIGIGFGIFVPALSKAALEVDERFSGMASGFNNAVSRFTGLIAVVVLGTLMTVMFARGFAARLQTMSQLPSETKQQLLVQTSKLLAITVPETVEDTVQLSITAHIKSVFLQTLRLQFVILGSLAAAAAVCTWKLIPPTKS